MNNNFLKNFKSYVRRIQKTLKTYQLQRSRYRYSLIDVVWNEEHQEVELFVIVSGVKKQILSFTPDEILYDDELLSEFSPCDIRAITYLTFRKYICYENSSLVITGQILKEGITIFQIKDLLNNESTYLEARKLYQHHDYLTRFSKKDMINVIATAIQEQTISDLKKMEGA